MKSCLYYSNWSVYAKKHFVHDIPLNLVTHLFYAFIGIDPETGKLKLTDTWADLELPQPDGSKGNLSALYKLKQQHRNLKICMSIGGWGTSHLFTAVTSNKTKLNNFVSSVIEFIIEYGFDGVDIDWEYPENENEAAQLLQILSQLRQELNRISHRLTLSIACPASYDKIAILNLPALDKYVSFYNVMCYDFAGSWSGKSGFHSNLFGDNGDNNLNCNDVLNEYQKNGVCSGKLVMGMPNYGRSFGTDGIGKTFSPGRGFIDGEPGIFPYKALPIGKETVDTRKVAASCFDSNTNTTIVYDNEQTTRIKAQFLKSNKYGGGMRWESNGDDYNNGRSLLSHFVDQIGEDLEQEENHLDIYGKSKYLNK